MKKQCEDLLRERDVWASVQSVSAIIYILKRGGEVSAANLFILGDKSQIYIIISYSLLSCMVNIGYNFLINYIWWEKNKQTKKSHSQAGPRI